jgi:hypothetical protein
MGMDAYSESGIIASTADMLNMIRKKDVKTIKKIAALCREDDTYENWEDGRALLASVETAKDLDALKSALERMVIVHGEPSKYGSDDCYIDHADEVLFLWQQIAEETRPELPALNELRVFDSGRLNGWDVPHGEACFIWDDAACFKRVQTDKAVALKKAIGHCEPTEWTIVSY